MNYNNRHEIRLKSCASGITTIGPEKVHIDLNNKCQLNCVTCWDHSPYLTVKKTAEWNRLTLPTKKALEIVQELSELKVERIILSGGEIFLHPNVMDIISHIKQKGMKLTLISNILAISHCQAHELVALGVDTILANVSSATSETYANYHPNQNQKSFEKLLKILETLKQIKDLKFVQVINNVNYHEIPEMINLASRFKAKLQFKLASLSAPGTEKFELNADQINFLKKIIPSLRQNALKLNIENNFDAFETQLSGKGHEFPIETLGCYAGYYYSRIKPDGKVYFCCKQFEVGDVYAKSFIEIWYNSTDQNRYRKLMRQKKYFPKCSSCGNWTLNYKINKQLN